MARLLQILVALAAVLPATVPRAEAEGGGVGIALVDAPTNRADDPRAQRYIVDHLHPGDVIERRVRVENTAGQTTRISLYAGAVDISEGRWEVRDGATPSELTSWISVAPDALDLEAGTSAFATVRIAVPVAATAGERYGVIWAQLPPASSRGVTVVNRVGVRIYLSVGDEEPAVDFALSPADPATAADGTRLTCVRVENTGGRAIDIGGSVVLTDRAGDAAGPFPVIGAPVIAPTQAVVACLGAPASIAPGPWDADVTITGGPTRHGLRFPVTFPEPDPGLSVGALPPDDTAGAPTTTDDLGLPVAAPSLDGGDGASLADRFLPLLAAALLAAVTTAAIGLRRRSGSTSTSHGGGDSSR